MKKAESTMTLPHEGAGLPLGIFAHAVDGAVHCPGVSFKRFSSPATIRAYPP